jgi:hypothetical protein
LEPIFDKCPYSDCPPKEDMLANAEFRGKILESIENLRKDQQRLQYSVEKIWEYIKKDIDESGKIFRDLYYKMGLIAGGISLIVSITVRILIK